MKLKLSNIRIIAFLRKFLCFGFFNFFSDKSLSSLLFIKFGVISILWLLVNNTIYLHSHELDNGNRIIHAHPFDKSAENSESGTQHTHTVKELVFISFIDKLVNPDLSELVEGIICFEFINHKYEGFHNITSDVYLQCIKARPPPYMFS
jgi:hypothetical protein